jgi:predicted metal-dependent phosphoesterase TrpH
MKKILFALLMLFACSTEKNIEENPDITWYKGNTHTHTVLCGHADTSPDTVAMWYLDRGYNFLILSEHNTFIEPDSVNLPENRREDFILIPGEEVSDEKHIHTTAMNINRLIPISFPFKHDTVKNSPFENLKIYYMQKHVDSIRAAGGIPILNHPNWQTGVPASAIQQVERLHMIELHNGHPDVNNWGNEKHASMEVKWDSLLTAGRKIYGVSSDDAHFFHDWGVDVSNPGRGWVMVRSKALTPDAITEAMTRGDFYSTSGVMLSGIAISEDAYEVRVDTAQTYKEIASPYVVGYKSQEMKEGFWIEFISDGGKLLKKDESLAASLKIPSGLNYVRAKVTYSRIRGNSSEQFFAWTQPLFLAK